jgi:hypothetical protein
MSWELRFPLSYACRTDLHSRRPIAEHAQGSRRLCDLAPAAGTLPRWWWSKPMVSGPSSASKPKFAQGVDADAHRKSPHSFAFICASRSTVPIRRRSLHVRDEPAVPPYSSTTIAMWTLLFNSASSSRFDSGMKYGGHARCPSVPAASFRHAAQRDPSRRHADDVVGVSS